MYQINCTLAGKTIPGKIYDTINCANEALAELRRIAKINDFPAEYTVTDLTEALSLYREIMREYLSLSSGPLIVEDFDQVKYAKTIEYLETLGGVKIMRFNEERMTMILVH